MQMRMFFISKTAAICAAVLGLCSLPGFAVAQDARDTLDRAVQEQLGAQGESARGQSQIDALDAETRDAMARYRALLQEEAALNRYNEQLARQVAAQREALTSLDRQLGEIDGTAREVLPLMQRMVATLEEVVSADMPFLQGERTQRVASLVALLDRADVTVAEKYRRILEAYQVEAEYGRTLEAYQGELPGERARQVAFLRVGRVALLYLSLDGQDAGYWSSSDRAFVAEPAYRNAVRQGLRIARRQVAPDWVQVPVVFPEALSP